MLIGSVARPTHVSTPTSGVSHHEKRWHQNPAIGSAVITKPHSNVQGSLTAFLSTRDQRFAIPHRIHKLYAYSGLHGQLPHKQLRPSDIYTSGYSLARCVSKSVRIGIRSGRSPTSKGSVANPISLKFWKKLAAWPTCKAARSLRFSIKTSLSMNDTRLLKSWGKVLTALYGEQLFIWYKAVEQGLRNPHIHERDGG